MSKTLFLYSGEGTHSSESQFRLLKYSKAWRPIEEILSARRDLNLERLWEREIGRHRCPYSPLLTVITEICLADLWTGWGYRPDVVIGHSTGELAAAYQAGLYDLETVLLLAHRIGQVAARLDGRMAHGILPVAASEQAVHLASTNFEVEGGRHVTLSGHTEAMDAFIGKHPDFVKMRLPHPWHHPDYRQYATHLARVESHAIQDGVFISGVTGRFETRLEEDYWHRWLAKPIDFIRAMQAVKERYGGHHLDVIEIGFHPVLERCCTILPDYAYASSMFRGEDDIEWILFQRKKLGQDLFREKLQSTIAAFNPHLEFDQPLSHQGLGSLEFAELSEVLQPLFPSLAPQDFYRFKTVDQLKAHFGAPKQAGPQRREFKRDHEVVISGMSCRLPASVETPAQFWDTLLSGEDQVQQVDGRGGAEAGFLSESVSRFDHRYFGISQAEARTMDPQQILALELTEMLFRDADIDPQTLDKSRVGVYIGVWNQEYWGDKASVFLPTGTNPSIIASRISYHYDLRGPSWVSNTACSSSLVAVHYAVKDIEAGRVDYAVAGGVNMLLDEGFSSKMRNSGFLSRDNRCKTFDNTANGYVRAEGGGLVLLVNKKLAPTYYAVVSGSAINQNGRRSQVITAPHPEAQGELILSACRDAGIPPTQIAYVECHGTGTKIGDPIEISALKETVARDRKEICHIGSVKSNLGHLESAAGIAGLIKSLAVLNHGVIPPNLHFLNPNEYIDFESHNLRVVTEETRIDPLAHIGISSFGFGGSNAHIIVKGAGAAVRKKIRPGEVPFDRERAAPINDYLRLLEPEAAPVAADGQVAALPDPEGTWPAVEVSGGDSDKHPEEAVTRNAIDKMVGQLIFELANIEKIDPDVELIDQGLDSLSGTELISQLEIMLGVEISPDLLLENPLPTQFADQVYALAAGLKN